MTFSKSFCCEEILKRSEDTETAIVYIAKFREFGISALDGGTSYILIEFCPWCGSRLPKKLRDQWFDNLEKLGIDDPEDQKVPKEFQTEEWWIKRGL